MTQHTPGPWTQPETKRTHNRWHVEGGGRLVAAAGGPQFAISADEADANARLIAAAPDLLEQLHWTWLMIQDAMPDEAEEGAFDSIRDTLAKATGD